MDNIAVACSWANTQVLADDFICSNLPTELLHLIQEATGTNYLQAIATAALTAQCTDKFFVLYEKLITEITARWLETSGPDSFARDVKVFSSLARILPLAPYLKSCVKDFLQMSKSFTALSETKQLFLVTLPTEELLLLLLAIFRLFTFDKKAFDFVISPLQLYSLLRHTSMPVRYLAIQCLCLYMGVADAATEGMVETYIGNQSMSGHWEGRTINFRNVKILEEKRWTRLEEDLWMTRSRCPDIEHSSDKDLGRENLSLLTAVLGGVLIPRPPKDPSSSSSYPLYTTTTTTNLRSIAKALLEPNPILVTGLAGSGKTFLIKEAASELGKLNSIVTLHLNEQTDAKSLLGLYASSPSGGSFVWQPGVLTKAMEEGRWILIEDIDRAPLEVISVLLPIIEQGEILLPSRRKCIRAHSDFRILATLTTSKDVSASTESLLRSLPGARLWNRVHVEELAQGDVVDILRNMFPLLPMHVDMTIRVDRRLNAEYHRNTAFKLLRTRSLGLRTLIKWCRRIQSRFESLGVTEVAQAIPETVKDDMFLDAVECYVGHLHAASLQTAIAACIAEEMHIPPQRMRYCLQVRIPPYFESVTEVKLGRASLSKLENRRHTRHERTSPFASTRHALRAMESILTAIHHSEPVLLVGETGIGKTALIQHLAGTVGQKLTVINLSQQSESSDLLGGYKPITTRSLALPLIDIFNELFDDTFSTKRNQKFQASINKCVVRQSWQRLAILWQEATQMADKILSQSSEVKTRYKAEQAAKRRRLRAHNFQALRERWVNFAAASQAFNTQVSRGDNKFSFAFVEGKIVQALRNGDWVLLDEINLAPPDTLESITSLLSSGDEVPPSILLPETGELSRITSHTNFRLLAAMNPATDAGKRDLAPSLRSRFTEIFIQPPDDDIEDLTNLLIS